MAFLEIVGRGEFDGTLQGWFQLGVSGYRSWIPWGQGALLCHPPLVFCIVKESW